MQIKSSIKTRHVPSNKLFLFSFADELPKNSHYTDECREYKVKRNVPNNYKPYSRGHLDWELQRISQGIMPRHCDERGRRSIRPAWDQRYRYTILQNTLNEVYKNLSCLLNVSVPFCGCIGASLHAHCVFPYFCNKLNHWPSQKKIHLVHVTGSFNLIFYSSANSQ